MAKQKEVKTNAMRILESLKIPFTHYTYECDEFVDGLQIADKLNLPYEKVYKTLVTEGNDKNYYVFVIPIAEELDLKAAAKSVGVKSVEMIHVKDINKITGIYPGRLYGSGNEKAVCDQNRQFCKRKTHHHCQWRKDRFSGRACAG